MADEGVTVLVLKVEGRPFAVAVHQVETLRRKETVFPARQGPPDLLGFLPMGAAFVPIIDLGMRLGIAQEGARHTGLLVVPPAAIAPLALRVDQVAGPVHLAWNELSPLPALLRELQSRPLTWALVWQGEEIVPLLDLGQVVPPEEAAELLELAAGLGQ